MKRWIAGILFLFSAQALAGFGVGRGGDLIFCEGLHDSENGYVSLDYAVTVKEPLSLIIIGSQEENPILKLLKSNTPELARTYELFLKFRFQEPSLQQERAWIPTPSKPVTLKDEKLEQGDIPDSCDRDKMRQAVIRTKGSNIILYHYDQELVDSLLTSKPLQHSFLMTHEWLWELTSDVRVVRLVNHFLHQKSTHLLSPEQFRTALKRMEISVEGPTFSEVCTRSPAVVKALESALAVPCNQMSYDTLRQWAEPWEHRSGDQIFVAGEELRINAPEILQTLDFSGLARLHYLIISDAMIRELPVEIFHPFTDLQYLYLDRSRIEKAHFAAFRTLHHLKNLKWHGSPITDFPPTLFRPLVSLNHLDLSDNQLSFIRSEWFTEKRHLNGLQLEDNQIELLSGYEFDELKELKLLSLSRNQISHLPEKLFRKNVKLSHLRLEGNDISRIAPETFKNNLALTGLFLSSNSLDQVEANTFKGIDLGVLDLSHNAIKSFGAGNLNSNQLPYMVNFSHNQLRELPSTKREGSQEITEWDMSHNYIEVFPARSINNTYIQKLDLSFNRITLSRDPDDYSGILIKELNLRNNNITSIPREFWLLFKHCDHNCKIDLSENPLDKKSITYIEKEVIPQTGISVRLGR